jgi:hypothetical protein
MKIVPKAGYGMNTAENRQVTAKESRNRNSNAAFGKIFGIIKFFKEAKRQKKTLNYLAFLQGRLKISKPAHLYRKYNIIDLLQKYSSWWPTLFKTQERVLYRYGSPLSSKDFLQYCTRLFIIFSHLL